MGLVSRFHKSAHQYSSSVLSDDEIRSVAPSVFGTEAHPSRSGRYTCIPTITVLDALRNEGFEPFMVCQTAVRDEARRAHTKHMLRLRHSSQRAGEEAHEVVLVNSHDGSSSYQMLSGMFRFVCSNGLVCGTTLSDVRVPHKGDVVGEVIEGAFRVLSESEAVAAQRDTMKSVVLTEHEQVAFARAALALRYDSPDPVVGAPVSEKQLLSPRRSADAGTDLWSTFNRVQENMLRGGLVGRNARGLPFRTRGMHGIDQSVALNRALWVLANTLTQLSEA